MADEYIRREDALRGVELFQCGWAEIEAVQSDYIERLPAADVAPVVHGKWIGEGDAPSAITALTTGRMIRRLCRNIAPDAAL